MKASKLPGRSIGIAGALALLSVAGSQIFDSMWLGLIPSAALLSLGLITMSREEDRPIARAMTGLTGASAGLLASLAVFGLFIQDQLYEPPWLAAVTPATGWAFVIALTIFGLDSARTRRLPRGTSILIATVIPIGLAADKAMEFLPGQFFFASIAPSLSIAVLGMALLRAGFKIRGVSSARQTPLSQGHGLEAPVL